MKLPWWSVPAILVVVCLVLGFAAAAADMHARETLPCSDFAGYKLHDLPARCLTHYTGDASLSVTP